MNQINYWRTYIRFTFVTHFDLNIELIMDKSINCWCFCLPFKNMVWPLILNINNHVCQVPVSFLDIYYIAVQYKNRKSITVDSMHLKKSSQMFIQELPVLCFFEDHATSILKKRHWWWEINTNQWLGSTIPKNKVKHCLFYFESKYSIWGNLDDVTRPMLSPCISFYRFYQIFMPEL